MKGTGTETGKEKPSKTDGTGPREDRAGAAAEPEARKVQPDKSQLGWKSDDIWVRREAHKMTWCELFPSEKEAIRGLLIRMMATMEAMASKTEGLAPCFLVTGARGTGKTTVLVNLQAALDCKSFFDASPPHGEIPTSEDIAAPSAEAKRSICELRESVFWLNMLDMEFFPEGGNPLAALLVRIRDVLTGGSEDHQDREEARASRSAGVHRHGTPEQLMEERESDAWLKIDSLINSATLMWERVSEGNARVLTERQIDIAEFNAAFREDLRETIKAVTEELRRRYSIRKDTPIALALPIDNADRSARHIAHVVKLIHMISLPEIWFVLAGNDNDLDVFLEKAHRIQLGIPEDEGRAALSPDRASETVGIARRQAASDSRSVLPPANRVVIESVGLEDVLSFPRFASSQKPKPPIRDLLADLKLNPPSDAKSSGPRNLSHLLPIDSSCLNPLVQAGAGALRLPARTVQDLYQLALTWCRRQARNLNGWEFSEYAAGLLRDMVENLVAESELTERACKLIRGHLMFKDAEGRVCLDLRGDRLAWRSRITDGFTMSFDQLGPPELVRFNAPKLVLYKYYGCKLYLCDGKEDVELPEQVAGWLMMLYDVLKTIKQGPRVLEDPGHQPTREPPLLVQTAHVAPIWSAGSDPVRLDSPSILLRWPVPHFDCFNDYDWFAYRWTQLMDAIPEHVEGVDEWCRFLVLSWIDLALAVATRRGMEWAPRLEVRTPGSRVAKEQLEEYRTSVFSCVAKHYAEHRAQKDESHRDRTFRRWLEQDLFLLLRPEFTWNAGLHWDRRVEANHTDEPKLSSYWRSNAGRLRSYRRCNFREALKESEECKHYRQRLEGGYGPEYMELHRWIDDACARWFENVDRLVSEPDERHLPKAHTAPEPTRPGPKKRAPAKRPGNHRPAAGHS